MIIEKTNINTLISPDWNPRQITPEEMEKLENSLQEFGYIEPIIVNRVNNHVVGGNQRLEALKRLGYTEVDVIYVKYTDINKEKAANIALNKISGEWDYEKLEVVLEDIELSPIDISLTGFDEIELTDINITPETKEGASAEPVTEHKEDTYAGGLKEEDVTVKIGDVYLLGDHKLMCGDSSKKENIDILIESDKIDLLLTDPPYGINIVNTTGKIRGQTTINSALSEPQVKQDSIEREREHVMGNVGCPGIVEAKKYKPILNDDKPYDPTTLLNLNVNSIIWGANNFSSKLPDSPRWLVWYKKPMDKKNNDNFSDVELAWTNIQGKVCKLYHYLWSGLLREGNRDLELKERVHPTQKPVGLLMNILNDFSEDNDNILDLYGGSGSTLIACEQTNRNCYMMELDPYYCQVIINRWEAFTGEKAVKIN